MIYTVFPGLGVKHAIKHIKEIDASFTPAVYFSPAAKDYSVPNHYNPEPLPAGSKVIMRIWQDTALASPARGCLIAVKNLRSYFHEDSIFILDYDPEIMDLLNLMDLPYTRVSPPFPPMIETQKMLAWRVLMGGGTTIRADDTVRLYQKGQPEAAAERDITIDPQVKMGYFTSVLAEDLKKERAPITTLTPFDQSLLAPKVKADSDDVRLTIFEMQPTIGMNRLAVFVPNRKVATRTCVLLDVPDPGSFTLDRIFEEFRKVAGDRISATESTDPLLLMQLGDMLVKDLSVFKDIEYPMYFNLGVLMVYKMLNALKPTCNAFALVGEWEDYDKHIVCCAQFVDIKMEK